jgi:hypothetical protein
MKKAFTMIELLFGVVILGFLYVYGMKINMQLQKNEDRELAFEQIAEIIDRFIFNPASGYVSNRGGNCSDDYTVKDISAYRIQQCADIPGFEVVEEENSDEARKNGEKSYFRLLPEYAEGTNEAMKFYIDDVDEYEIKILFVSEIEEKGKLEQYLGSMAQNVLKSKFQAAYYEAESLNDTTYNGNAFDGKIRIHFKN